MKILVLGISISDINLSEIISEKILFMSSEYDKSLEILPTTFDKKLWITNTGVPCWYCRNNINDLPIPIPVGYDGEMKIKGVCCSYTCARRYILYYRDPDIDEREINIYIDMLNLICKDLEIIGFKQITNVCHFYEEGGFGL